MTRTFSWAATLFFSLGLLIPALAHAQTATAPHLDSNGWTVFTPSADTHVIYVSSSMGNDSTCTFVVAPADPYNPTSSVVPCKTIAKAMTFLRNGYPDWLLMKKGDTWTDEVFGTFLLSGRSQNEPMLIGAYGSGPRPKLDTSGSKGYVFYIPNIAGDYLAIVGLEMHSYDRDPSDARFSTTATTQITTAVGFFNAPNWVLMEDNKVSYYSGGVTFQPADGNATIQAALKSKDIEFRRNVVAYIYGGLGMFLDGFEFANFVDNVIDHNGWNNTIGGDFTRGANTSNFNHNLYETGQHCDLLTSYVNGPITMVGNIMSRDATGSHLRSGGNLNNNLWIGNTSIADFGRPRTDVSYSITNDVYLEDVDQPGVDPSISTDGWGMNLFQKFWVNDLNYALNTVNITKNIYTHFNTTVSGGFAISLEAGWAGFPQPVGVSVTNNVMYLSGWNTYTGAIKDNSNGASGSVFAPNDIYLGPNVSFNTVLPSKYPDPNRTIESYDRDVLGGPGTMDHFFALADNQSKDHWDPRLTAEAVNDYVRAGFGMAAIGMSSVGIATGGTTSTTSTTTIATSTTPTTTPTSSSIGISARVKTTSNLNVRNKANTKAGKILCMQPAGSPGTVVGGPQNNQGYIWWQVKFDTGCSGWVVQSYLTTNLAMAPSGMVLGASTERLDAQALMDALNRADAELTELRALVNELAQ